MSRELELIAKAMRMGMPKGAKAALKERILLGIKMETIRCKKEENKNVDQILQPAYDDKGFMVVLGMLGVDKDGLRQYVETIYNEAN